MHMHEVLDYVVTPTLERLARAEPRINSEAARRLVTCTAQAESAGDWLRQIGGGPARGLWQIEPPTAIDVLDRYLETREALDEIVWELRTDQSIDEQLVTNMALGAAICRLKYWMSPEPMPDEDDAPAMGRYWKQIYNTAGGAGDPAHFTAVYADLFLD